MIAVEQRVIEAQRRVHDRLTRLARSRLPIIVGPWTGEVGFELLYWIPFLQWACETFPLDPERLVVVSRGGVAAWYGRLARNYDDVFNHTTLERFQALTTERKKQYRIRELDRITIKRVMKARALRRAHLLHPALMYGLYKAFWRSDASTTRLEAFTRFQRLKPVDSESAIELGSLPARFVAVRFYFSSCFPDSPDNRQFAARVIEDLSARAPVVLLNNDIVVDDHRDFTPERRSRVFRLGADMRPETNLAVQTAVINRATAFVGTYGGYSYLAPLCGVGSVAFYSRPAFKRHHLELAQRAFQRIGKARLIPLDLGSDERLSDVLAGAVGTPVAT